MTKTTPSMPMPGDRDARIEQLGEALLIELAEQAHLAGDRPPEEIAARPRERYAGRPTRKSKFPCPTERSRVEITRLASS